MARWFLNKLTKCTWDISDESLIKRLLNEPDLYEEIEDPSIEKETIEEKVPEIISDKQKMVNEKLAKAREALQKKKEMKNG